MLGFVQSWMGPKANPIGVDFGTDSLRLAQVQVVNGEHKLIAAASADVPNHVRNDAAGRIAFFVETARDLLVQGGFRGREAVLALPAAAMFVQHLKLPKMDDAETRKALPWEARGKLPIDPTHAILRHIIAGEIYQEQEPKQEVICLAARRDLVNQLLAAAAKAKLDVVGMNVEPRAIVDCFNQVYRRKTDLEATTCYVDIGSNSSRAVVARGQQILFARVIPIGGDHFNRAAADALKMPLDQARLLRLQLSAKAEERAGKLEAPAAAVEEFPDNSFALLGAGLAAGAVAGSGGMVAAGSGAAPARPVVRPQQAMEPGQVVDEACREPLTKLIEELDWCRRYHEATFPKYPLDRLIFVGGEARQKSLCQHIAREMGLAAQVGDPMVRMARTTDVPPESGLDRRQPQPGWAVALGLSMSSVNAAAGVST